MSFNLLCPSNWVERKRTLARCGLVCGVFLPKTVRLSYLFLVIKWNDCVCVSRVNNPASIIEQKSWMRMMSNDDDGDIAAHKCFHLMISNNFPRAPHSQQSDEFISHCQTIESSRWLLNFRFDGWQTSVRMFETRWMLSVNCLSSAPSLSIASGYR